MTQNVDEIVSVISDAWNNREEIKKVLRPKVKVMQDRALLSVKLMKELLDG